MNSWHHYNSKPSSFTPNILENTYLVKNCSAIPHIPPINEVVAASSSLKRQNAKLSLNLMKRKIKPKRNKMNSTCIKINPKDILSSTRINNSDPISSFFYESPISSTFKVQPKERKKIIQVKKKFNNYYYQNQHQGSNKTSYANCCCGHKNKIENLVYPINFNNKMIENVVSSTFNQLNNIYPNASLSVNGLSKNEKFNNFGDIFVWYV